MMSAVETSEARVLEACRRRLRDSKATSVTVPVHPLARELNVSPHQLLRALRRLAQAELVAVEYRGPHAGRVVVAPPSTPTHTTT